nr:hypothetical protein [Flavobacterium sp. ASV13]
MIEKVNLDDNFFQQEDEIHATIRDYWIVISGSYIINDDKSINVDGSVKFTESSSYLTELPLQFNKVSGDFNCSGLNLMTLKGAPVEVGGTFNCSYNRLASLEFAPIHAAWFIFDNTVACLSTGNANYFDDVLVIFRSNEPKIPTILHNHPEMLATIFKYQDLYQIWEDKESLNTSALDELIQEINEGLE